MRDIQFWRIHGGGLEREGFGLVSDGGLFKKSNDRDVNYIFLVPLFQISWNKHEIL